MVGSFIETPRKILSDLYRRGPFSGFAHEMDDLVHRVCQDEGGRWPTRMFSPPIDVIERDDRLEVQMDLPGIQADDIDIQVTGNQMTISGERKGEEETKGDTYHRLERCVGRFSRSIALPCEVEADDVHAVYREGVLNISLPKPAESQIKHIPIEIS